jgi:ribosomal protein L22
MSPPDKTPDPAQPAEPAASGRPPQGGWESLKVDELRAELEARGLPKSGNKDELVARLREDEGGADAPEAAAAEAVPEAGVAEEVLTPEEPAEEPSADEVEEAEGPVAEAEEGEEDLEAPEEGDEEVAAEADEEDLEEPEEGDEGDEAAPAAPRRGSAEVSTGRRRAAPRVPEGDVVVRARSKYVRSAPRKARLVMDHIRGKEVEQARAILGYAPRSVADDILKLLNSAVANAESTYELGPDELRIRKAFVDGGPTIKRFRPRALGRATRINKRTSHMTIELTTTGNGR